MASIQILEIRPIEDQIEELSYDTTGSIWGGSRLTELYACVIQLWIDLAAAESPTDVYNAQIEFATCVDDVFGV